LRLFCESRETDEALKIEDNAPIAEKQGEQEDAPTTEENKDNKDVAAKEEEENEEDKVKATLRMQLCGDCSVF
jgi:hypothetical protein